MALPPPIPRREDLLQKYHAVIQKYGSTMNPEILECLSSGLHYVENCTGFTTSGILSYLPVEIVDDIFSINIDIRRSTLCHVEGSFGQIASQDGKVVEVDIYGMYQLEDDDDYVYEPLNQMEIDRPTVLTEIHQLHGVRIERIDISSKKAALLTAEQVSHLKLALRGHYEELSMNFKKVVFEGSNRLAIEQFFSVVPSSLCTSLSLEHFPYTIKIKGVDAFLERFLTQRHDHRVFLCVYKFGHFSEKIGDLAMNLFLEDKMMSLALDPMYYKITTEKFKSVLQFLLTKARCDYYRIVIGIMSESEVREVLQIANVTKNQVYHLKYGDVKLEMVIEKRDPAGSHVQVELSRIQRA
ncbi:hypothetical protein QR680_011765 [Steinernema hermaphroditum]|uniref:Uncharacterized protein n=1 Tax=Steinernema hermaphroditum TaxID=289476 RepID=A0AA39I167_9BILA|nr:hypothetical protein QR680_011765 [Steinernema hermaphroditum]